MTTKPATPKTTDNKTDRIITKVCSAKKLLHRAVIEMADEPTLAKAERKAMGALAEIQIVLDEIEASKQGGQS